MFGFREKNEKTCPSPNLSSTRKRISPSFWPNKNKPQTLDLTRTHGHKYDEIRSQCSEAIIRQCKKLVCHPAPPVLHTGAFYARARIPAQAKQWRTRLREINKDIKRFKELIGDSDAAYTLLRTQAEQSFKRKWDAMSEHDKSAYDIVTKKLDQQRPLGITMSAEDLRSEAMQAMTTDDSAAYDEVDVLDPSSTTLEQDRQPLKENIYHKDSNAHPAETRTYGVLYSGYRVDANIAKILGEHQKKALEMILLRFAENAGMLLAHGMGAGKTLTALAALHAYATHNSNANFLVVCPKTLILQWYNEMQKFDFGIKLDTYVWKDRSDLCPRYGSSRLWKKNGGVGILGFDLFRAEVANMGIEETDVVIVDEAHLQLKSSSTLMHKALDSIASKRRLLLSGSPVQPNGGALQHDHTAGPADHWFRLCRLLQTLRSCHRAGHEARFHE